jgi:hypothetical protein
MKVINTERRTGHVRVERPDRMSNIENSVGWGEVVAIAPDRKGRTAINVLTSTGVFVVRGFDGNIITAWVASKAHAKYILRRATGNENFPAWLWEVVKNNSRIAEQINVAA